MSGIAEFALFILAFASLPTVLSLTKGRDGTFTDNLKNIATFGWTIVCTILFIFIVPWLPVLDHLPTIVGCLMLGFVVSYLPVHYFDGLWAKHADEQREREKDIARKDEIIEDLRNEIDSMKKQ